MEELISLAQGDGGPIAADTNDGFGLFYLGCEKRMLAMDSKVRFGTVSRACHLFGRTVDAHCVLYETKQ